MTEIACFCAYSSLLPRSEGLIRRKFIVMTPLSHMCSFNEVSKTTYALVVSILEGDTAKISVPENRTLDVAGNPNAASVVLQVKHCK